MTRPLPRPDLRALVRWAGPVALLGTLAFMHLLGDRWWPTLPLLYGPRFVLAVLLLTPILLWRRNAWRPALTAFGVGGLALLLVLDVRVPWRTLTSGHSGSGAGFRVLTWNAGGRRTSAETDARRLIGTGADVVILAECSSELETALGTAGLHAHRTADVCLATRYEVVEWAPRDPRDFWEMAGSGSIGKLVIDVAGTEIVIGGVHLETPRDPLEALANRAVRTFRRSAIANIAQRDLESSVARGWIAPAEERRPVILGGDFNLVVESAIYQRWWGDLDNAFNLAGAGLGWSKETRLFGVRIDHVLVGGGIEVRRAHLLNAEGSDHRPLMVELDLQTGP